MHKYPRRAGTAKRLVKFERAIIHPPASEGRKRARANAVRVGRPPELHPCPSALGGLTGFPLDWGKVVQ